MLSLMLSSFVLLSTFIMANSTPSTSRQTPFLDSFRKEKQGPPKIKSSDQFLQARASKFLTPKEQDFDMPIPAKYGSTGRPPGKYHLRHSPKEFNCFSELPYPPFDIFFIESTSNVSNINIINNKNNILDNGKSYNRNNNNNKLDDDANNSASHFCDGKLGKLIGKRISYQIELLQFRYVYKYNSKFDTLSSSYKNNKPSVKANSFVVVSSTTTSVVNYDHNTYDVMASYCTDSHYTNSDPALQQSIKLASNNNNRNNFDPYYPSTSATTTTTTTTINNNASANGKDSRNFPNSIHRTDPLSIESVSNNNDNNNNNIVSSSTFTTNTSTTSTIPKNDETFHLSFMLKLITLYLIITKSFSAKEFTKEQKEKQHHHHHQQQQQQQHYHGKRRHQFHLEQQQKHQHFKQEHHNVERMAASIVLKLTLVAWDMWTYRNGF
jgi:hypothetical protein